MTWESRSPAERDGSCATNREGAHEACAEKDAGLKASATSLEMTWESRSSRKQERRYK
jgi:hypothetical protein